MTEPNNPTVSPADSQKAGAGSLALTAAPTTPRSESTVTPSAAPAAASSNAAAMTDGKGRTLVEQGYGAVSVSRAGDDVLLAIDCNGAVAVRLAPDTARLLAQHLTKLTGSAVERRSSDAAKAAVAVDRGSGT